MCNFKGDGGSNKLMYMDNEKVYMNKNELFLLGEKINPYFSEIKA